MNFISQNELRLRQIKKDMEYFLTEENTSADKVEICFSLLQDYFPEKLRWRISEIAAVGAYLLKDKTPTETLRPIEPIKGIENIEDDAVIRWMHRDGNFLNTDTYRKDEQPITIQTEIDKPRANTREDFIARFYSNTGKDKDNNTRYIRDDEIVMAKGNYTTATDSGEIGSNNQKHIDNDGFYPVSLYILTHFHDDHYANLVNILKQKNAAHFASSDVDAKLFSNKDGKLLLECLKMWDKIIQVGFGPENMQKFFIGDNPPKPNEHLDKNGKSNLTEVIEEYDGIVVETLCPQEPTQLKDDENNNSIITKVTANGNSILMLGDAETDYTLEELTAKKLKTEDDKNEFKKLSKQRMQEQEQMLEYARTHKVSLSCKVLKVAHHGSINGFSIKLMKIMNPKPEHLIVCCGDNTTNVDKRVINYCKKNNVELHLTAREGNIDAKFGPPPERKVDVTSEYTLGDKKKDMYASNSEKNNNDIRSRRKENPAYNKNYIPKNVSVNSDNNGKEREFTPNLIEEKLNIKKRSVDTGEIVNAKKSNVDTDVDGGGAGLD